MKGHDDPRMEEEEGGQTLEKDIKFLSRADSLDMEIGNVTNPHNHVSKDGWRRTMFLAFQSIGIVYGDIGTSPLYVYSSTFTDGIKDQEDILGVLSLIIYTLLFIPMMKYVFIVLKANDNGDGGTFALYSLICRYAKISLLPNQQVEDALMSNYRLQKPSTRLRRAEVIKEKIENNRTAKIFLFLVTILGTSMVMGDGVLTPCISVLSAVGGISTKTSLSQDAVVGISIAILIVLFAVQRFGTDKVGYSFAPIVVIWFFFIGGIGVYNLFKHDVSVLKAFNPAYIFKYFKRNGKQGWVSLGGILLCITGTEAMFADLGHFNIRAIQISFTGVLLPSVSLAYIGQAAFLRKFPEDVGDTFYKSIPGPLFWPTFVVAVAAAIIASQAMISGAFAIISQSLTLGCFPRVKVLRTSAKYEGQVYIPEINYILMISCVIVTAAFKTTAKIGNAYGIAVISVMLITTFMVSLIMLVIWKTNAFWIASFAILFGAIEVLYFSSALYKFSEGGFLPLALAFVLMCVMGVWHFVHVKRYEFELENKVSSNYLKDLVKNPDVRRIPGIGLLYSELVQGVPPIFPHYVDRILSIHSVLVFVSIKHFPFSKVAPQERFLFREVNPRDYRMFRCVVRYGYNDVQGDPVEFEHLMVENLKEFVHQERFLINNSSDPKENLTSPTDTETFDDIVIMKTPVDIERHEPSAVPTEEVIQHQQHLRQGRTHGLSETIQVASHKNGGSHVNLPMQEIEEEIQFIQKALDKGVVYLLGEAEVVADKKSSLLKRAVVNHIYSFLRKNFRQGETVMGIPRSRLLRVGMTYEI